MNPAPASELGRAGQMVGGKFRLDAVIGRGAMGTVWAATHVNLGHRVAIKLVANEFVRSPEVLRRFDAEAKAAARLQSRHVVQVFDSGALEDGTPYIAMELLSGQNLDQRIRTGGPLPLAGAVHVLGQCCKALARAHAAGIVHRDIKPDNVFLARNPDEDVDVVKILDFGVAKIAMALEGWTSRTGTGSVLGTPIFMSPEQVRGSKEVDHRTDLYSLGLVAFTSLSGTLAIDGESFGDVLLKICAHPLPSLCALVPSLPRTMDTWFQRACAREPAERHQSAQEFIDTLRVAASELPGRAPHPEVRLQAPPQPPPPPQPSAGTALSLAVAAPMAETAPSVSVTAATDSGTAAGLPRVRPAAVLAALGAAVMVALTLVIWLLVSPHRPPPAVQTDEPKDQGTDVRAAGPVSVAPPLVASSEPVDASSAPSTPASAKPRTPAAPPTWVPAATSPRAPAASVRAAPNPLGY